MMPPFQPPQGPPSPFLSPFLSAPPPGMGAPMGPQGPMPAPNGQMPPIPPELGALLTALMPQPPQNQPTISDLDRWAMKNHGVMADQLPMEALDDLMGYVRTLAGQDRLYWQGRNDRIVDDDDYYNLMRPGNRDRRNLEDNNGVVSSRSAEDAAQNAEIVVSPLPRLVVDKLVAMLSGADWPIEVPARTADGTAAAQKIENLLRWFSENLSRQFSRAEGQSLKRQVAIHGVLSGWMCALMLPDPSNVRFPWRVELEDPVFVYPRFNRGGIERVTRQLVMTAMDARSEYPEAEAMLEGFDDDSPVTIVGYYDKKYRMILIEGMDSHSADAALVLRPIAHHCQTLEGEPLCPWIINLPNGRGMRGVRRMLSGAGESGRLNDSATIGVGALYAMRDSYDLLNKIASQLATNVARDANPAIVQFLQPGEEPKDITTEPGGRSYLLFQRNAFEVVKTTPSPGDLQPLLSMVSDWLQKATLPSVFWGDSGGGLSGFAVGLLTNAAKDVLLAYADGMAMFLNLLYERALETLMTAFAMGVPPLAITQRQDQGRLVGGVTVGPQDIMAVGSEVQTQFQDLTPQDVAGAVQTEMIAVQGRFHSRETAMRKTGVQDTELENARIDLDQLKSDPVIAAQLSDIRLAHPDISVYAELAMAHQIKAQLIQQQMAAQQAAQQAPGAKPGLPSQTLPPQMQPGGAGQPPAREDAAAQQQRGGNNVVASMLAAQGGSPPAPQQ